MIIDDDINAYLADVNKITNVFNVFNKMNIVQFEIESAIFHEEIFVERKMLKINIIYRSSRERIVYFNRKNNHDFLLIIRKTNEITISAATLLIEFIIFSIIILFVFEFIIIIIIIAVILFALIIIKIIINIILMTLINELIAFHFDIIMFSIMSAIFNELLNDLII